MIALGLKDVKKSYGIDEILKGVTFNINEGERVGLIGPNGAGKSTLFKILTGELKEDSGDIFIDKKKRIGYLSQHLSLNSDNTIFEEMLLVFKELTNIEKKLKEMEVQMSSENGDYNEKLVNSYTTLTESYEMKGGYTYKGAIGRVLKGLGFTENDYDKNINILSGGQKTRVALCKLLLVNPDIILLDEPTNHLDLEAIEWLEDTLKNYKGTVLVISHDRYFLDSVTQRTFELIGGKVECYNGNYTAFIELKKTADSLRQKAYDMQAQEIERQEKIIERYRSFNREKSIRAAESREKKLAKIERLEAPKKEEKIKNLKFETVIKSGNDVLHVENLSKAFENKVLFNNLNLHMRRGEKNALIGENGRGKTTFFKILLNKVDNYSGFFTLGKNVYIGYYDQEQSNLHPEKTVIDEVWDDFPNLTTTKIRNALAAFLFCGDDVFKKVSLLSGGERCRINLLKLMLSKNNFLLLDEPTNHLDIMSREALESALLSYDGTVLVISHDRYFLNKVVDKIYELNIDGAKEYLGNYTYYIEKKKNPLRFKTDEEQTSGKTKTQLADEKRKKRDVERAERQKKLKVKEIESDIENSDNKLKELQASLCLEEVYTNPEKSASVSKEIKDMEEKIKSLYSSWEEASE